MTDKEMIQFWKSNEKPFGLCPKECQRWLEKFHGHGNKVLVFRGIWESRVFCEGSASPLTYRIPADYEPEKRGRWVECEVETECGSYWFYWAATRYRLSVAPDMVGFGGVRYEGEEGWHGRPEWVGRKEVKPTPPVSVRFWVEE